MEALDEELDAILSTRAASYDHLLAALEDADARFATLAEVTECRDIWGSGTTAKISNVWKESYAALARLGKSIERTFKVDAGKLSSFGRPVSREEIRCLNVAVAHHFYRSGLFSLADQFVQESGVPMEQSVREKYLQLDSILTALAARDLSSAIQWAEENGDRLKFMGSDLEFQLLKAQFLQLLGASRVSDAIAYSKSKFLKFTEKNQREIQKLMGSLAFVHRLQGSPYKDLFTDAHAFEQVQLREAFITQYAAWMGLPSDSPVELCLAIGLTALPKIMKVSSLMKDKAIEWTTADELPVEIPIPDPAKFHSVFTCPVSKEPASLANPPMMMPCGHVISKEALHRLARSTSSKFKCPYCPSESLLAQAIRVNL